MNEFEKEMFSMMKEFKNEVTSSLKKIDFRISNIENEMLKMKNEISTVKKNISDTSKRAILLQDELNELQESVIKVNKVHLNPRKSLNNRDFMSDRTDVIQRNDNMVSMERKKKVLVPLPVHGILI